MTEFKNKKVKNSYFRKTAKCWYNDNGFCKFDEECRKRHFKTICVIKYCDRKCEGRHPRLCQFEERCRFLKKGICAFKHVTRANDDEEINALKTKMELLETENKNLKNKFKVLENNIAKEKINNQELKEHIKEKDSTIDESKMKITGLEKQLKNMKNKTEKKVDKLTDEPNKKDTEIKELIENQIGKLKEELEKKNRILNELNKKINNDAPHTVNNEDS